ncbi:hypothetical protein DICPUDRAFT_20820, partial [Dictyostelium purpureum]
ELCIDSNVGGKDFSFSINPRTDQIKIDFFNPFIHRPKGEKFGIQMGPDGFLNNKKSLTYYQDRNGNVFSLSKSSESPFGNSNNSNSIFNIEETSLAYSYSLFNQTFSIISSDCSAIIGDRNNNKIHKAHTGNSYKTSIQNIYKIKDDESNSLFCRLHSEIAVPYLSSCSFLKSQLFFTKILKYRNNISLRIDGSIGNIFNFKSQSFIPLNERFFNGKNYGFPGFKKSSLSDNTNGAPYLGSTAYYTIRTTLSKKINHSLCGIFYFNLGNFNLSINNKDCSNRSIISNLNKNIRTSFGLGISFDMGDSLILVSMVKPINYFNKDKLNTFSL